MPAESSVTHKGPVAKHGQGIISEVTALQGNWSQALCSALAISNDL